MSELTAGNPATEMRACARRCWAWPLGDGDHLVGQVHGVGAVGVVAGFNEEPSGLAVTGEELFGDVGELPILEGVGRQEKAAGESEPVLARAEFCSWWRPGSSR